MEALNMASFLVLSTCCSASSTCCFMSRNFGLFSRASVKASSTEICMSFGRPGRRNLISVFLSKLRKEARLNMALFKAISAFCNVLRALTASSFSVSNSALLIAAILCRSCPVRYKVSVEATFSFARSYSACAIARAKK